jgi:hypothetical protein
MSDHADRPLCCQILTGTYCNNVGRQYASTAGSFCWLTAALGKLVVLLEAKSYGYARVASLYKDRERRREGDAFL